MNQKFSLKIAALLATFSGTALAPSAMLPVANSQSPQGQPASLPPIVSPAGPTQMARPGMLAPIDMTPRASAQPAGQAMPWKVDRSKYQQAIAPYSPPVVPSSNANQASAYSQPAGTNVGQAAATQTEIKRDDAVKPAAQFGARANAQLSSGFSSSGVPIYTPAPPAVPNRVARAPRLPRFSQGSGTRGTIGSGVQAMPAISPQATAPPAPAISGQFMAPADTQMAPMISPGSEMIVGSGDSVLANPPMAYDNTAVINQAPLECGYITNSVADSVVGGGCSTCNVSGAAGCESGGNCNCGPGGCYNPADISGKAGLYGSVGEARYYTHVDALLMDRRRGDIAFSTVGALGDFDLNGGARITLGQRYDAINGREFSYMGISEIGQASNSNAFNRAVRSNFALPTNVVGASGDDLRPFGFLVIDGNGIPVGVGANATYHEQLKSSYFHSFELNRVRWGWDVIKSFVGIRYIHVNDRYRLLSENLSTTTTPGIPALGLPPVTTRDIPVNPAGQYEKLTLNNLIGPHIGTELFYDVGYRWSVSLMAKGGIHANLNQVDTRLSHGNFNGGTYSADTELINDSNNGSSFATSVEGSLQLHYQIAPRGRLRLGYNVLHLEEVATVADNVNIDRFTIPANFTGSTNDNDNMTFLGFNFGLEFYR